MGNKRIKLIALLTVPDAGNLIFERILRALCTD